MKNKFGKYFVNAPRLLKYWIKKNEKLYERKLSFIFKDLKEKIH